MVTRSGGQGGRENGELLANGISVSEDDKVAAQQCI